MCTSDFKMIKSPPHLPPHLPSLPPPPVEEDSDANLNGLVPGDTDMLGFSILAGFPWYLIDKVHIPINYGDEFHWVLAIVVLKKRHIRVYDSMSKRRHYRPSSEIQNLAKILSTYLDVSDFLDQKVRTDWSMIEAYRDKIGNPSDIEYVKGISQQPIGSLCRDCGFFIAAYAKKLSDGLQVPNDGLDAELLRKIYATLLWKYGEAKAQKSYASNIKDPR
ncbi:hypothetical protein BC332_23829 [Capsicum chinense]|nr:hypothetical protein BC332_23829 [Capsicum chinense]